MMFNTCTVGVLLRVQLNVLAGHLFTTRVSVSSLLNNNRF